MDSTYCEKGAYCQDHTANQENLMDTNNWRSTPPSGEPTMDTGDWRTQLQPDSRQRIVNKIMDTLKRHLPFSGLEGLNELRKIAVRFEEKIFTAARSQPDYLRRISLKMLTMETKSQNTIPYTGNNSNSPDLGSQGMQNQVHSQGQSIPIPLQSNQSQARQQLLPQNVPNNMATAGVQSSAGLQSGMPSVSGLTQNPMPNVVGQNSNMQSMSGISQNLLGQGMPSNIFANQQRQMQERQQMLHQQKQQQHLYHQQLQHQLMKQKIQQGNLQPSLMQPHMQQQNLLPPAQLQSSQQSASFDSTAQTGHANGGDWQEEVYQKIKTMKETYLPELNEVYQKIAAKLQQHDSLPQQPKSEQLEKLKLFKNMLERIITFLTVSKANILPAFKDKLSSYEKQIINFINTNRPRKSVSALQQGQLPPPHMHSMQQPQPQINQTQSHDSQMNPQLQSINLQGSVPTMQSNNMTSLQHNSLSSLPGVSTAQQTMLNSLQPGSNLDSGQGNALGSMQQVAPGSLQQNPVSSSQQANINSLSSQSGLSVLQQNMNPLQSNSNMLQHQHLKQQEQQMLQSPNKLKQFHQRQIQHQYMQQKHPLLQQQQQQQQQQQLQQQAKQQLPTQLQTHQMPQLHQMNDVNDMRLGMGVKPGVFQHLPGGQHQPYTHQQLKPGAQYPISSPQLLQAASPQMPQHSSPQIDQQSLLTSISKTGTPLQSANSPFVVPSPSTPLAPSPMPGESEKPVPGTSTLSNAANVGHQQGTGIQAGSQSLAIGTPGISASPLLAEFTGADGTHANALKTVSSKSNITEQPLERLMKAVKSMSPIALGASVSDIGSVVSMTDRIAGSAPGNGSRAAVGEDLVAMTKCRLQARNFITQDGMNGTKKMRRYTSAMPLNVASSAGSVNDSFKQFTGSETSDLESTATSSVKRPRIEANHALLEEIREINQRLIDTVVDISDEDVDPGAAAASAEGGEGTIVKCSFSAVALSSNLKSQYMSAQMSPIQPLRLLVPTNYPNCSPILLDKFPVEVSKEYEDLSVKAKSRFSISLRTLSQPMSLGEIARTWDVCARAVISEHAQQSGGGSFSSKYGTWENYLSAA